MSSQVQQLEWQSCYDDSWKGYIVDEAFAHPAKFARGLIERIFKYMLAEGMLRREDVVVDPFGGIGAGGIVAASRGLRWYGCELEEKFVGLARQNFALHENVWLEFGDPQPVIVQGDSRKLRECLAGVLPAAVVSSPPFCDGGMGDKRPFGGIAVKKEHWNEATGPGGLTNYGQTPGQLAGLPMGSVEAVVSSPPFLGAHGGTASDQETIDRVNSGKLPKMQLHTGYGDAGGQLGAMKPGTVDSVVSSPPYAECLQGDNTARETAEESRAKRITEGGSLGQSCRHAGYGSAENLGNLKGGTVADALVSSPPYEGSLHSVGGMNDHDSKCTCNFCVNPDGSNRRAKHAGKSYGAEVGNIGNEQGETFWAAAKAIVTECHAILKPQGWSCWVVKSFVRDKQIVDFPGDWCKLLEACGFTVTTRVHAMLVKETRSADLFGGERVKTTERKSFFRRLAEKKGSPRIDFEEVVIAQRSVT